MKLPKIKACLLGLAAAGLIMPTRAAEETLQERLARVIRHAVPAFVFIAHAQGNGSGVVISPDGYALTNQHVVQEETELFIRLGNGNSYKAKVVGRDRQGDIALLKIEADEKLPYLKLGDSDKLDVGDLCVVIGNPLALGVVDQTPTVTTGVVSGLHQFKGGGKYNDAIVTDAPINPGNSGGPLINMNAELVGVNGLVETRIGLRSNSGLGYAIPANQIKLWLPHLRDPDRLDVYRGRFMGVEFETDSKKAPEQGALVKEVEPDSDAAKAGLKEGDIIVKAQDLPVWNFIRFAGILNMLPAGTTLTMRVNRGAKLGTLTFKLPERRPADFGFNLQQPDKDDTVLTITEVKEGSAAAKAGLKAGDKLIGIDDQPLNGPAIVQYLIIVQRWMPTVVAGAEVKLKVQRGDGDQAEEKEIAFETD